MSAKIDPFDRAVAARVRAIRKGRGLSQTDVAERLGVSYQQFQKYESGANRISAGNIHKLAKAFDLPVSAFFEGEGRDAGDVVDSVELELLRDFRGLPSPELQDVFAGLVHAVHEESGRRNRGKPRN